MNRPPRPPPHWFGLDELIVVAWVLLAIAALVGILAAVFHGLWWSA